MHCSFANICHNHHHYHVVVFTHSLQEQQYLLKKNKVLEFCMKFTNDNFYDNLII